MATRTAGDDVRRLFRGRPLPPILDALECLGVHSTTIARLVSGTSVTVAFWRTARAPIPRRHHTALLRVLGRALVTARAELQRLGPNERTHVERMRHRLARAEAIFKRLQNGRV